MGPRERYRQQVRDEVKRHAWEQIATAGVTALSLNAIAKQMGVSGPALYRYFANRDELITALIRDAYQSLAEAVRGGGSDLLGLAKVIREWALADPHRYLLIYGTPVPGYHAPADTTAISDQVMQAIVETAGDPATAVHRGLLFWTRLHGVLSLELAGHFAGMSVDPAALVTEEIEALADRTGR